MLNMTKNSAPTYSQFPQQNYMMGNGSYNANSAVGSAVNSATSESTLKDVEILTTRIQSFLNSGSQALAIAESKTEQVAKMQPDTAEYKRMVEEVKAFQARASYDFKQAEALLATANSLLPKKKNN